MARPSDFLETRPQTSSYRETRMDFAGSALIGAASQINGTGAVAFVPGKDGARGVRGTADNATVQLVLGALADVRKGPVTIDLTAKVANRSSLQMSVGVINAIAAADIPWEVTAAGVLSFDATPDDAISVAYDAAYGEFCAAWAANSSVTAVPAAKRASGVSVANGRLFRIAIELTLDEDGVTYAKFYANDNLFYRGLTSLVPDTTRGASIGLRPYVAFGNSAARTAAQAAVDVVEFCAKGGITF